MKKIYIFCTKADNSCAQSPNEDVISYAVDIENKWIVAQHFSSNIRWAKHDMGITSNCKHAIYQEQYPSGYQLIWVGSFESFDEAITLTETIHNREKTI